LFEKDDLLSRIHRYFRKKEKANLESALSIDDPTTQLEHEIAQRVESIDLSEQLQIIHIVKAYLRDYVLPGVPLDPSWVSGYAMHNQIFVSEGQEIVTLCNMEAFYQEKASLSHKLTYMVSLIRFNEDPWRVFQVKEKELFV
jgi:hypothetical protein